jgi:hypothetical protein
MFGLASTATKAQPCSLSRNPMLVPWRCAECTHRPILRRASHPVAHLIAPLTLVMNAVAVPRASLSARDHEPSA